MSVLFTMVAVAFTLGNQPEIARDEVTAEQFLRLVKAQQSSIRDVAFAFEGEVKNLGPADVQGSRPRTSYQGRYALRSDGATYLEFYYEGLDNARTAHPVDAMIGGRGEQAQLTAKFDVKDGKGLIKMTAGPGSFFKKNSPEAFNFLWRMQTLKTTADFGYAFLGWEDVDGHRCAHIQFNAHPNVPARVIQELWVDLERGAHPLRIKNSHGQDTIYVVDEIRLGQFSVSRDEKVWFPIGGRTRDYLNYKTALYEKDPTAICTTYVLDGSLMFNQGLGDKVFHVKGEDFRPSFQPKQPAVPIPPTAKAKRSGVDFADAEKKLDAKLADPARSVPSDAAASMRDEASRGSILGWGLGGLGLAALVGAGVVAFRRR